MPGKSTEGVDEETKPKGGIPQDPKPEDQPQDPKDGEEDNSQDPNEGEGTSEETDAKPTENVNVHKLERNLANREKRIKELEAELAESKKLMASSDERISAIEQQLKTQQTPRQRQKLSRRLPVPDVLTLSWDVWRLTL